MVKNYADPVEVPSGGKWKKVVAVALAVVVIGGILTVGASKKQQEAHVPAVTVVATDARIDDGGDTYSDTLKFTVDLRVRNDTDTDVAVADLPSLTCGVDVVAPVAKDGSDTLAPGAECVVTYTFETHRQGPTLGLSTGAVAYNGLDNKKLVEVINRTIENYNDNIPMKITYNPDSSGSTTGPSGQSVDAGQGQTGGGDPSSANVNGGNAAASDVPAEYTAALKSAKTYSDMMHMSKAAIYDQLVSEYGDKFPPEAAQYAVDNVVADWNENALKSAENYRKVMSMSTAAIYDQLISEYGDKFTPEEAQYAVDHLQ